LLRGRDCVPAGSIEGACFERQLEHTRARRLVRRIECEDAAQDVGGACAITAREPLVREPDEILAGRGCITAPSCQLGSLVERVLIDRRDGENPRVEISCPRGVAFEAQGVGNNGVLINCGDRVAGT
jgi:hypothetical protein